MKAPARPSPRLTYPWAELYALESQASRTKSPGTPAVRGRPRRPIPRHNTTISLTGAEAQLLMELSATLAMHVGRISQGQVGGLALHLLERRLRAVNNGRLALPDDITTWQSLAMLLRLEVPPQPELPLARQKKTIPLTDEEQRLLRELTAAIGRRIAQVSLGEVGGLALRMLASRMRAVGGEDMALPDEARDWDSVVRMLDVA